MKIKENSKTNCPKCGKKKVGLKYVGHCYDCVYPEVTTEKEAYEQSQEDIHNYKLPIGAIKYEQ